MSFSQPFDYHCYGTASISSSYKSIVLVEKEGVVQPWLSRYKATRPLFPILQHTFFKQLWAQREMCLTLFVENFREHCQVT